MTEKIQSMVKSLVHTFFLLPLLPLLIGCNLLDQATNPDEDPQIIVFPEILRINDTSVDTLTLSVQPASKVHWEITTKPDWLTVSPSSGNINKQLIKIVVSLRTGEMPPGNYYGNLEIITDGAGKASAEVKLTIDPHPAAEVEPTTLTFLENEGHKNIIIENTGTGFLEWEFSSYPEWIEFDYYAGIVGNSDTMHVKATAVRTKIPVGIEESQIILTSNAEDGGIQLETSLEVPVMPDLLLSSLDIRIGYFENSKDFSIMNTGNVPYGWSIGSAQGYLTFSPSSGHLDFGDSAHVTLSVNRDMLDSLEYSTSLTVVNDYNQSVHVPVTIKHYEEKKWLINGSIIDAEFDRNNEVIVAISDTPYRIRKFAPVNEVEDSLQLTLRPTCISVGVDGNFAVVGHDGYFSYVNLTTMQVVETYPVTTEAFDIILAPNNWVYVMPAEDQWERIRCFNLSSESETIQTGDYIRERTKMKLHPLGNYIYGADNGLSPSDIEKYDITNGTAEYLYDSPYHGDYEFNGDIWISDDGQLLFVKSRNVFNSSTVRENDMTYSGNLEGTGQVITLDHHSSIGKIYAIFSSGGYWSETPDSEVRIYGDDLLNFIEVKELPQFFVPDNAGGGMFYKSKGHYGFFNEDGSKFYVLVSTNYDSEDETQWAITSLDIE